MPLVVSRERLAHYRGRSPRARRLWRNHKHARHSAVSEHQADVKDSDE